MKDNESAENHRLWFRVITAGGVINLLLAAERIWRGQTWKERWDVALVALFIICIWTAGLRLRRAYDQANGIVESGLLARVADNAYMAIIFGYLALLWALSMMR